MNPKYKRLFVILSIPLLLVISLGTLYLLLPRTGYCFDSAFNGTGERLYVTAGYKGLHIFEVSPQGDLTRLATYFDSGYYRYKRA